MSSNPKSMSYRDPNLAHEGRAVRRKFNIDGATRATSGQAGLEEGNRHRRRLSGSGK